MDRLLSGLSPLRSAGRESALTATEPAWVFAFKSLLHPLVAVGCLIACLMYWHRSLHGPYFLIAVLTFLGSAEFLPSSSLILILTATPLPMLC